MDKAKLDTSTLGSEHSPTRILLTTLYAYLPLLLPLCLLTHCLLNRYASPLRHYPGPLLASFTRLYKMLSVASGHTHEDMIALHAHYGPIVRLAPNELSLSSPEAARQLLSAGKGFHKTKFYGVFPPPENPDIFTETREHVHAQKKRVANVPYSMGAMQQLAPFIDDTIALLMEKMDGFAAGKGQVDLGDWLHFFAFDVLGEVAFSRSFGFLEQGVDVEGAIRTIDDSQWYNGIVGQVPELDHLLRRNPVRALVPALSTKVALITRMALAEMEKRKPFGKQGDMDAVADRKDLLQSLIEGHLKSPERFGEGDVFAVAHGAIFAGSDSTASTMQSFFWHVLRDPHVHKRLVEEIASAADAGALSHQVQWAEAQKLPYFQACLKEALRVRPAVGVNIVRLIPQGGAEVDGLWLPGGTSVAVNGWVLHLDKDIFGADADTYRPERWLEDEERSKKMERYMFHFGGGAHLCIGRNMALLEINKVIPRLLRDYDISLVDPERKLKANVTFFVVQSGLEVHISKRR